MGNSMSMKATAERIAKERERMEKSVEAAMKEAHANGKHATFDTQPEIAYAYRLRREAERIAEEAENLEWRATYTKAAREAAALAALALADSRIPLVCSMQLEMNHLHYCNDCHRCGVDCMPSSCSANCCPVGRSEPDFYENLEYDTRSKQFEAAEKKVSVARVRLFDSLDILRSGKGNTSEASVAVALDEQRLKNAESDLKEIETERSIWVTNCSGKNFKRILEIEQKAENTRNAAHEYEMEQMREDLRDM